ncbi:MAG: hypothetical protein A3B74_01650 [Candidatus Kerfeldbacteria bacterium RIFCSPHIGHO2_02_FULL_42_14]|uniref:Uncharacterized protein n=1 Tax=Candidatus Kerfeldbacteria bacterium RIFCSPHIGHO2_02_FULL_42_14 TaxID=1798540 RepID=A0A1G2ATD1_9BACT|nr:MAG: hypothetical protein A3B74_01650 [Candidatus Kerfeldbacteria bacterium RIFCSPHIGHO2_02_FULL_42_14]OGY82319.1 MAG: hypothetical protein A3E60_03850 [Candidatus Kerfeldbacteria bacterium RIFCSPHIGHO2_12_FULL_42_13]OGY84748.1 MAG: hypothetical protein A3I91_05650 [Candidatus Kerfeldbacteria bacterium RIFCSPLOWO2_02_FULL_42_19]
MFHDVYRTARVLFFNLFFWYLVASLGEFFVPGFVTLYVSLWSWLWLVVFFGIMYLCLMRYRLKRV